MEIKDTEARKVLDDVVSRLDKMENHVLSNIVWNKTFSSEPQTPGKTHDDTIARLNEKCAKLSAVRKVLYELRDDADTLASRLDKLSKEDWGDESKT